MSKLTDKQYLELNKLSYLYEEAFVHVIEKHRDPTLKELADILLKDINNKNENEKVYFVKPHDEKKENGYMWEKDFRDTLEFIRDDPVLSQLVLGIIRILKFAHHCKHILNPLQAHLCYTLCNV